MKYLRLILLSACLCGAFNARASTFYEVVVTVTNVPLAGDRLTINGSDRTWTNATAGSPAALVLIGASIGGSATNLYTQLTTYMPAGVQLQEMTATNKVRLLGSVGTVLTVTLATNWGTIVTTTFTGDGARTVKIPASLLPNATRTNDYSLFLTGLNDYAQAPFAATAVALGNHMNLSTAQTNTGWKTHTGGVTINNSTTNLFDGGRVTNSLADGLHWTNRANWPGAIVGLAQSLSGNANNRLSLRTVNGSGVPGSSPTYDPAQDEVLTPAIADNRYGAKTNNSNFSGTNNFNQVTITNLTTSTVTSSTLQANTISGATTVSGSLQFTRTNNTSLANGDNTTIDFGTVTNVKLKAGPTAAFAICGIQGGANGKWMWLRNATGQNMTLKNESGTEPTPANRIVTDTGADIATTGNGSFVLEYDTDESRWIVRAYIL